MALTSCAVATDIIANLGTNVTERGLTTDQFKAKFDKGLTDFVAWFNATHLVELTPANIGAETPAGAQTKVDAARSRDISINIPGDIFATTGIIRYVVGSARTVSKVRLAIGSAPTGADLIIDVHKNGTTMFTTTGNRPKIIATATSGVSVAPNITALAEGDVVTIDIDQVGSTLPGTGLAITLMCT